MQQITENCQSKNTNKYYNYKSKTVRTRKKSLYILDMDSIK